MADLTPETLAEQREALEASEEMYVEWTVEFALALLEALAEAKGEIQQRAILQRASDALGDSLRARADKAEAQREKLARWKGEALPVLDGLQELGEALGLPLGVRITGPMALEAVETLKAERDHLREVKAMVQRDREALEALHEQTERKYGDLVAAVRGLADEWASSWPAGRANAGDPHNINECGQVLRALVNGGGQ